MNKCLENAFFSKILTFNRGDYFYNLDRISKYSIKDKTKTPKLRELTVSTVIPTTSSSTWDKIEFDSELEIKLIFALYQTTVNMPNLNFDQGKKGKTIRSIQVGKTLHETLKDKNLIDELLIRLLSEKKHTLVFNVISYKKVQSVNINQHFLKINIIAETLFDLNTFIHPYVINITAQERPFIRLKLHFQHIIQDFNSTTNDFNIIDHPLFRAF